jgi:ribosomal protein L44E
MRIIIGVTKLSELDLSKVHTLECRTCNAITAHKVICISPFNAVCLDHTEPELNIQEDEIDEPVKPKVTRNKPSRKISNFTFTDDE